MGCRGGNRRPQMSVCPGYQARLGREGGGEGGTRVTDRQEVFRPMLVLIQTDALGITRYRALFFPFCFHFPLSAIFFLLFPSLPGRPHSGTSSAAEGWWLWGGGAGGTARSSSARAGCALWNGFFFSTLGLSIWAVPFSSRVMESPSDVSIGEQWETPS